MIAKRWSRTAVALSGWGVAAALAAQLVAGTAWAAEEGAGGGNPWMALLWKTINFVVLVGLLWYFGRKPTRDVLSNAAQQTWGELDLQRRIAREAEETLAEQRGRIEGLQSELEGMVSEAREEGRQEHARLTAEARAHAERIKGAVQMQIEHEMNKARKELQAELAEQTMRLAERMISERLDDASRQRLTTRAIEQLGAGR